MEKITFLGNPVNVINALLTDPGRILLGSYNGGNAGCEMVEAE